MKLHWNLLLIWVAAASAGAAPANLFPPELSDVSIEQRLGSSIPLDAEFRDESGVAVRLRDYMSDRPVVLMLVYYQCPMLCNITLNQFCRSLNALNQTIGRDFDVITISFDPREGPELASAKKAAYLKLYRRPGAAEGWHFLTGTDDSIKSITAAVGFHYRWDARHDQFAHASAVMMLTPRGVISRYFLNIDFPPTDLRNAIKDAADGKKGPAAEHALLYCFAYDPTTGRYGWLISRTLQLLSLITLATLIAFTAVRVRRERCHSGN